MGPRSGERGNIAKQLSREASALRLQWGRAQVSAEINVPQTRAN